MYDSFFGFKEKPFDISPDPRFLYQSNKHREALALLIYGAKERKGFIVLSGELGTGKTTVIRAFLEGLDENCQVAYIPHPNLRTTQFFRQVCQYFGLPVHSGSKIDHLRKLHDFLVESHEDDKTTILIFDDAHNLDVSLFEEIRMLTNLETSTQKLLQVYLVGQPKLDDLLDQRELRNLRQRISARYQLLPLDYQETKEYIQTRMRIAGARNLNWFTEDAIQRIYKRSGGVPSVINTICHKSLLRGYAKGTPSIDKEIVQESVAELKLARPQIRDKIFRERREIVSAGRSLSYNPLIILVIFLALVLGGVGYFFKLRLDFSEDRPLLGESFPGEQIEAVDLRRDQTGTTVEEREEPGHFIQSKSDLAAGSVISKVVPIRDFQGEEAAPLTEIRISPTPGGSETVVEFITVTVEKGDTISNIVISEFGRSDEQVLEAVRELNPEIEDLNHIDVGQVIRLPRNLERIALAPEEEPEKQEGDVFVELEGEGEKKTPYLERTEAPESLPGEIPKSESLETTATHDRSFRTEEEILIELGEIKGPEKRLKKGQSSEESSKDSLSVSVKREEVRQFFATYLERYTQKDIDGFLSLFSPKAVQNGRYGLDEIKRIYSDFFDQSQELRYHLEDTKIEIHQEVLISGIFIENAALVEARYEIDQVLKKGRKKKVWRGDISWILTKENGALRILFLDYQPEKSSSSPTKGEDR